ncbi:MAG: hypothetical protein MUF60_05855, partial [Vicinamibacterales bacterium]|nr:hypothetical protein [Vicinamibacterales bacterium]
DGGASWSMPRAVVDNYAGPGHQLMPALTFAAGKLVIAYYDFREDESGVYGQYVDEFQAPYRRHTVDLRSAMADPAAAPVFSDYNTVNEDGSPRAATPSTQVSRYLFGSFGGTRPGLAQMQFNPPNLPIFAQGTVPFMGDYIDVAGQDFTLDANRQWQFNTAADGSRIPLFHVAWTDNRDVRRPPAGQTWANYKSPTLGPSNTICDAGSNPGSRNQNVYTATLMPGLVVTAPGNHKTLGAIQRAFVVFAKNTTAQDRYYRLTLAAPPAGAFASFTPIDEAPLSGGGSPAVTLELGSIFVPRRSSIARSVFIVSPGQQYPQVTVNVVEVNPPAGQTAATAIAVLNPDIENPDIENPDIENPDIENPDIENPDIENAEVYNPDIENPDIANPDIENPDIENPDIENPDIENPDIANPDIANPDIANPDIESEPRHREPRHREPGHREPGHREPGHREPGHREPDHRELRPRQLQGDGRDVAGDQQGQHDGRVRVPREAEARPAGRGEVPADRAPRVHRSAGEHREQLRAAAAGAPEPGAREHPGPGSVAGHH